MEKVQKLEHFAKQLTYWLRICCPLLYSIINSEQNEKTIFKVVLGFLTGFGLGQLYYRIFVKDIIRTALFFNIAFYLGLVISIILGVACIASIQIRCILLLLLPMFFGKAGRGVLKAIILTHVVAGPITNLGLNAQEVVRVFACTTQFSYYLSNISYARTYEPLNKALLSFPNELKDIKETIRSINSILFPIENECEGTTELYQMKFENDFADAILDIVHDDKDFNVLLFNGSNEEINQYQGQYIKKMKIRCENQLSHAITLCINIFSSAYEECSGSLPPYADLICLPLMLPRVCDIKRMIGSDVCDFTKQIETDFGDGYACLKLAKKTLISNLDSIKLNQKIQYDRRYYNVQDVKKTGDRVLEAFEAKYIILKFVMIIVNIFIALLFLRIPIASINYHDLYLTSIDYDNVYITDYFKRIDEGRRGKNKLILLPLKKMERSRYIDVYSAFYIPSERSKLLTQILKVMLEAVTATTFVMLDRLFYEALDVVKQHALEKNTSQGAQDIDAQVEGKGALSNMLRKILKEFTLNKTDKLLSNEACVPRPRAMAVIYYFKIYGGYLWILILLYINPYTLRLRRLICSYFYTQREKERILHLYNDILKKRTRMQKTLRKKAIQAVRAHYLSGENLLSIRMKYPQLLGWLNTFPVARMKCVICEETEPRLIAGKQLSNEIQVWHSCIKARCPFVYCNECWCEVGAQCLACDPVLADLSDVDSLTDDNPPRY